MSSQERVATTVMEALERRMLFKRAMRGAGALAAVSALTGTGLGLSTQSAKAAILGAPSLAQDVAILTFALNLEYLEAEYYLRAVTGSGLSDEDRAGSDGTPGGTVTAPANSLVPFTTPILQQFADTIAADEQEHVRFIRSALTAAGATVAAAPAINVGVGPTDAFSTLGVAAKLVGSGQSFNPYADEDAFLLGAFVFEDVGVTAYAGAAASIFTPAYLTAAASILAVEAYHSGTIRTLLAIRGGGVATDLVANLRSMLATGFTPGQAGSDDYGTLENINDPSSTVHLAPLDAEALAYTRTPEQVLTIVYGGGAAGVGGLFFPSGLSGGVR